MKKELLLSALAAILVATCFGTTAANADNVETETDIKTNIKAEESTEIKADEKIELSAKEIKMEEWVAENRTVLDEVSPFEQHEMEIRTAEDALAIAP